MSVTTQLSGVSRPFSLRFARPLVGTGSSSGVRLWTVLGSGRLACHGSWLPLRCCVRLDCDKELPPEFPSCSSDTLDARSHARTAQRVMVCRRARDIANFPRRIANEPAGRLPGLEAPLVDLQSLDLRLQCRGGHTEARRSAEWSCHPVLAFPERSFVLFVGRQRAGGQGGDRRVSEARTGKPPRVDRERVQI